MSSLRWVVTSAVAFCLALLFSTAPAALAAVVATDDAAALQQALDQGGEVTFGFSGTVDLPSPLIIRTNVTLDGRGRTVNLESTGTNFAISRLITVQSNAALTIRNLGLSMGRATNGGAILNNGTLVVSNCTFSENIALGADGTNGLNGADRTSHGNDGSSASHGEPAWGGAIFNAGQAVLLRSRFITNSVFGGNGGNGGNGGDGEISGGDGGNGGNGGNGFGGAIYNVGHLAMRDCFLRGNNVIGGNGGNGGTNGTGIFPGLSGRGGGGGAGNGAGVYNLGIVHVEQCALLGNNGFGGDSRKAGTPPGSRGEGLPGGASLGGGICNLGTNVMVNCTAYRNSANGGTGGDGGDYAEFGGEAGDGGAAWGGGIYSTRYAVLTNCTLSESATFGGIQGIGGSGVFLGDNGDPGVSRGGNVANNGGTFLLKGTILANPPSGTNVVVSTNLTTTPFISNCITNIEYFTNVFGQVIPVSTNISCTTNFVTVTNVVTITNINLVGNAYGTFTDAGYNLSSDNTPALGATSLRNTMPRLGGLAEETGLPPVLTLMADSPAIDRGDPAVFPPTDQRGVKRPQGPRSDIGAYEREAVNLSGRVWEGTNGLPGVTIIVGDIHVTTTDTNGYYAFTNLPAGSYLVLPEKEGFDFTPPVRAVTVGPAITNVDFTAVGIWSIQGRVRNGVGGTGVPGVTVTAGTHSTVTDANGFYALPNLGAGPYTVRAEKPGCLLLPPARQVEVVVDVLDVNFEAFGLFTISGRVIDEDRSGGLEDVGLSNAVIRVESTSVSNGLGASVTLTARSDAFGNYSINNVPAGNVTVIPDHPGYAFVPALDAFVLNSDRMGIDFVANQAFTISGRITADGVGLPDVLVDAYFEGAVWESGVTDSEGYYAIPGVIAGNYEVVPTQAGYAFTPPQRLVTVGPDATGVDFTATVAVTLSGFVTRNGVGVPGVTVAADAQVVTTDATGFYTFPNLPPGFYTVTPYLARHVFQPEFADVDLTTESVTNNFVAIPIYNVSGRILEGTNAFPDVEVTVGDTTVFTDENGYYTFVGLPAGTNRVAPSAEGFWFMPAFRDLVLTGNVYDADFTGFPLYSISGRITTEGGTGASGVTVRSGDRSTTTDFNGYYTLTDFTAGTNVVEPDGAGYNFVPSMRVVVLGPDATNVDFTATGTLAVSGRVTTPGGSGVANVNIMAGSTVSRTDSTGYYTLSNLPPAQVSITPQSSGYIFTPPGTNVHLAGGTNVSNVNFRADAVRMSIGLSNTLPLLTLTGPPGRLYRVQAATNLAAANWQTITNIFASTNTTYHVRDTNAAAHPQRFYRAVTP